MGCRAARSCRVFSWVTLPRHSGTRRGPAISVSRTSCKAWAVGVQSVKRVQPAVSVQASRRCDSLTEVPLSRLPECCKWRSRASSEIHMVRLKLPKSRQCWTPLSKRPKQLFSLLVEGKEANWICRQAVRGFVESEACAQVVHRLQIAGFSGGPF